MTRGSNHAVCNLLATTMANLWRPPNIHVHPTPSEIQLSKESVDILEMQLQDALAARLPAEIGESRPWIARIPHDVISMIFLELSQMDWSAPLVLSQVCHG
jgi:hypothetical protein